MSLKYKHLEASREARLWLTTVILPTIVIGGKFLNDHPEYFDRVKGLFKSKEDESKK